MRRFTRYLAALTVAGGFAWLAACGSTVTGPVNVSLAGNYSLTTFVFGTSDWSAKSSGTLALTDSAYVVEIDTSGTVLIADHGTYTATDSGTFSEMSSNPLVPQLSGTYTNVNNLLTINATVAGVPVTQAWQKQ